MSVFKRFELEALEALEIGGFSIEEIDLLNSRAKLIGYEYTGSGYYLTVNDDLLPLQKSTWAKRVVGKSGDIVCGFVAFLENKELTLECHSWGPEDVPVDFRDREVVIRIH